MLSQEVTNQVRKQTGARQEGVDTLRIRVFLRMNTPNFSGSRTIEDLENFVKELKNVFDVMHVVDIERVELAPYEHNNISRTWFDHSKEGRDEDAPLQVRLVLRRPSWGFFPGKLKRPRYVISTPNERFAKCASIWVNVHSTICLCS